MILQTEIQSALRTLGLDCQSICVHTSLKSFGDSLENGLDGLLSSFLNLGCTVMMPTFSKMYLQQPVTADLPLQNGTNYGDEIFSDPYPLDPSLIYTPESTQIASAAMGAFPTYLVHYPDRVRGAHPVNSFTAVGPRAHDLIDLQTRRHVYAPFEALCKDDGYILLLGVHLDRATILHYAEQLAGRNLLVRWANDENGQVRPVSIGSCSLGFPNLYPAVQDLEKQIKVGQSLWRCFKAKDLANRCARLIQENPQITHCSDPDCLRCHHMEQGGPIVPSDFWSED